MRRFGPQTSHSRRVAASMRRSAPYRSTTSHGTQISRPDRRLRARTRPRHTGHAATAGRTTTVTVVGPARPPPAARADPPTLRPAHSPPVKAAVDVHRPRLIANAQHELARRAIRLADLVGAGGVGEREDVGDLHAQLARLDELGEGEQAARGRAPRASSRCARRARGRARRPRDRRRAAARCGCRRVAAPPASGARVAADRVEHDVDVAQAGGEVGLPVVDQLVGAERRAGSRAWPRSRSRSRARRAPWRSGRRRARRRPPRRGSARAARAAPARPRPAPARRSGRRAAARRRGRGRAPPACGRTGATAPRRTPRTRSAGPGKRGMPNTSSPGANRLAPGPTASTTPGHVAAEDRRVVPQPEAAGRARLPVRRVDARRVDRDEDLGRPGLGARNLDLLQDLRPAPAGHGNRKHAVNLRGAGPRPRRRGRPAPSSAPARAR